MEKRIRTPLLISISISIVIILLAGGYYAFLTHTDKETYSMRIIDQQDGTPIEGATIDIIRVIHDNQVTFSPFLNDQIPSTSKKIRSVQTDEDGDIRVSLPKLQGNDYYVFKIWKERYITPNWWSFRIDGKSVDTITSDHMRSVRYLCSTADLEGVVKDTEGRPIEGATVSVIHPRGTPPDAFNITDEGGKYRLNNIRSGDIELSVFCPGWESLRTFQANLLKFEMNNLDLILEPEKYERVNVIIDIEIDEDIEFDIDFQDHDVFLYFTMEQDDIEHLMGVGWNENSTIATRIRPGFYKIEFVVLAEPPEGYWWYAYFDHEDYDRGIQIDSDVEFIVTAHLMMIVEDID